MTDTNHNEPTDTPATPDEPNPAEPTDVPETLDDPNRPIALEPREGGRARPAKSGPRKTEIDSPGLLDEFGEDADFDADPELDRVVKGIPIGESTALPTAKTVTDDVPIGDPISGLSSWRLPGAIGVIATLTAAVFAGVYADNTIWAHMLITVYWAALHTATGVGAVVIAALLLGRPIGNYEGAAARMFMAVSLFLIVFRLDIPIPLRFEETILAAAAYFAGLAFAFRLPYRDAMVVGGAHFGLALLVSFGGVLSAAIHSGALG